MSDSGGWVRHRGKFSKEIVAKELVLAHPEVLFGVTIVNRSTSPGPTCAVCRPESVHGSVEHVVHSSRLDSPIRHSYQREFRTQHRTRRLWRRCWSPCELTIFGLGSHSATGEEWADNDNAGTAPEAQGFKRTCSCFGLGRYLYYFEGVWVDLDERKRPRSVPQLPKWATPEGWAQGLRPKVAGKSIGANNGAKVQHWGSETAALTKQIEGMAELLGHGLYRGLLRDLARVWNPQEIQEISLLHKVLEHMRSAERGLRRVQAALDKTGPEALAPILKTIGLSSLERVDNLETLKRIVLELEGAAENKF